jgi:hypothetical protein
MLRLMEFKYFAAGTYPDRQRAKLYCVELDNHNGLCRIVHITDSSDNHQRLQHDVASSDYRPGQPAADDHPEHEQ